MCCCMILFFWEGIVFVLEWLFSFWKFRVCLRSVVGFGCLEVEVFVEFVFWFLIIMLIFDINFFVDLVDVNFF